MYKIIWTSICILFTFTLCCQSNPESGSVLGVDDSSKTSFEKPSNSKRIIRGFSLQEENDSVLELVRLKNEDKDYTGGYKLELFSDYLDCGFFPLIKNRKCEACNYNSLYMQGFGFTPTRETFLLTEPVRDQRPFASFFGFGRKRIASFRNFLKSSHSTVVTEYVFGKVGGNSFRDMQNWIHRQIPEANQVLGWHNQIANGGRLGYYYKAKLNYGIGLFKTWGIFVTPEFTRGNISKSQGLGLAISNRHPVDISILDAMSGTRGILKKRNLQVKTYFNYLYMQHNTFLMGFPKNDNSIHVLRKEDINKHLVQAGFALYYMFRTNASKNKNTGTIVFELIWRNKDFVNDTPHSFGNLGFNFMMNE